MTTHLHVRGLVLNAQSRQWLEQSLALLQTLIPISVAVIVLEYRKGDSPAFRAFVSLAVPGPDIHADARDHTLSAAWLKVSSALRQQMQQRTARQESRKKVAAPFRRQRKIGLRVSSRRASALR